MSLTEYRRKRDFRHTTEPRGGKSAKRSGRRFVVQKHDASHLHYDFRLELDGVLKSWAVPKGPSLDPAQKRLAVEVEDHPLEYGTFEGTIPRGEYGGGTVLLWDRGTWLPVGDPAQGIANGKLKFRLKGKKLRGGWTLVRTRGRGSSSKPTWLLIKERDDEARPAARYDVTAKEPLSVKSGRDLDEIAARGDDPPRRTNCSGTKTSRRDPRPAVRSKKAASARHARAAAMPKTIAAQLATLVDKPPQGAAWVFEPKLDGYRMLTYLDGTGARLKTRNDLDWTAKLEEVAAAAKRLKVRQAIFDGEIVALDRRGVSDFQTLQTVIHERRQGALIYFVFDLLWLNGHDLRDQPLSERTRQLESLKLPTDRGPLRRLARLSGSGAMCYARAERGGLEGIIAKRFDRPYRAGRGLDWLKIKCSGNAEFVIGGFTEPAGSRQGFGALLLGYYDRHGDLHYAGRVGTGFDDRMLDSLGKTLRAIETRRAPFSGDPIKRERRAHWVRPKLVAQIRFTNWTRDGLLRHPVFLGLREDKPAASVRRELPQVAKPKARAAKCRKPSTGSRRG